MKKKFDDGSYIKWASKETIMYVDGEFSVEVWGDYFRSGSFSTGRIIKYPSVMKWSARPESYSEIISNEKRNEIIEKIKVFLGHCKVIIQEINGIQLSQTHLYPPS
ncbi:hypothetical protein [Methyloglobulus sp.]|uniref:hypothetical protein n=1 Tax=Methyloglobulus sp. TaxID=2518622 RepID=UPI0032B7EA1D